MHTLTGQGLPGGSGGLLHLNQGGAAYSCLYDGKGNVTALLDGNAAVAATYQYDPFGKVRNVTGSVNQPFQFSTKPYDDKTGLSYYGYRFYVPSLGRWLTRDPLEEDGGINLYAFVGNNPVNWIDPEGLATIAPLPPGCEIDFPVCPVGLAKAPVKYAGKTIACILKGKRGGIKKAPLPKGAPSWDDIMNKTWEQVENMLKDNPDAWNTIRKLLTNKRFDK